MSIIYRIVSHRPEKTNATLSPRVTSSLFNLRIIQQSKVTNMGSRLPGYDVATSSPLKIYPEKTKDDLVISSSFSASNAFIYRMVV
jgi:hypothetical protein